MSIKSWWKSLFKEPDLSTSGLPKVTCDVPMSEVKAPKPEKYISEPVLSFIEVYKANPKRFKLKKEYSQDGGWSYTYKYAIYDTKENKTFSVCKTYYYSSYSPTEWIPMINTKWATQDEIEAVYDVIFNERCDRHKTIRDSRAKAQREQLTKLYKGV